VACIHGTGEGGHHLPHPVRRGTPAPTKIGKIRSVARLSRLACSISLEPDHHHTRRPSWRGSRKGDVSGICSARLGHCKIKEGDNLSCRNDDKGRHRPLGRVVGKQSTTRSKGMELRIVTNPFFSETYR